MRIVPFNNGDLGKVDPDKLDHVIVSQASRLAAHHGGSLAEVPLSRLFEERDALKARLHQLLATQRRLTRSDAAYKSVAEDIHAINLQLSEYKAAIGEAQRRDGVGSADRLAAIERKLDDILKLLGKEK